MRSTSGIFEYCTKYSNLARDPRPLRVTNGDWRGKDGGWRGTDGDWRGKDGGWRGTDGG